MLSLALSDFPDSSGFVKAHWAPVLLRPIIDSPEQYVIGVAVASPTGFHLERANEFDRFKCFFLNNAPSIEMIARAGLDALEHDLSSRSVGAISEFEPAFSGIVLGDLREAEGTSLKAIATSWMTSLSSIYTRPAVDVTVRTEKPSSLALAERDTVRDRLPHLVLDYVKARRPDLDRFFSAEVRQDGKKRRSDASAVFIDFAGSKLVANFGTLSTQHSTSIDRIKRGLWDLKVDRDREPAMARRAHEMLVQHPSIDDPQISEKQWDRITSSLKALEQQADQVEIRMRPLPTVKAIADHLLEREAA